MKAVILVTEFLFTTALVIAEDGEFKCVPGVRYQENKCNYCHCTTSGLACTVMACLNQDPKLYNCQRGTTWCEACEQCWCTDLETVCTTDCGHTYEPHH